MDARGASIALALDGGEGLVLALDRGALTARRISRADARASGSPSTSRLPGAEALLALERRGTHYLVLARGACETSAHCLLAQALDETGALAGPALRVALPEPIRTFRRAAGVGRGPLFFAWSTTGGHRALERFTLAGAWPTHERIELGREPASAEAPVEILGLAADGERYAVVWRRGPAEDVKSTVHLTSEHGHPEVHALHEALAIDAIALDGSDLALVATFEFSRPHYLRFRLGEDEPREAREIAPGGAPPRLGRGRERAELDADARGLWLLRRDTAGDPVGERVLVVPEAVESAAIARDGDALVVAWMREGSVFGRRLVCR
jgi:hypothetical protein